jgi:LuxR family transcriptional regulator, maltose regulon positive regulatory protein
VDLSGLLQIHRRRFEAVDRTARHLTDVAMLAANPFYDGLSLRLRALNAYHQGHFRRAQRWAEQAVEIITGSLGESLHRFRCLLIAGMAAYHLNDLAGARNALSAACDFFGRESSHLSLVEARLGLSLVETAMGNDGDTIRLRTSALAMASIKNYDYLPILSDRDVREICTPALRDPSAEIARIARRLVNHPRLRASLSTEDRIHAKVPRQVPLMSMESGGSPPLVAIRTLGAFEVRRHGDNVITDAQWAGLRQKLLLKAIVVNGSREIPKDILMDALWPESSYEAALKRFKVTLHRLRRILEPDMTPGAGVSCIFLKDNLVSLDMGRCRVDVNDFLACCDEMRQLKRDGDDDRVLAACRRAVDLYRGDFLPEEPYLSWAEMKRDALKDQYLTLLMEMAAILERQGNLEQAVRRCRAAIQADPLSEHAHQQLMRLLQRQGRHSAALKVYRDLADILAVELDTTPDPATTRIYEEIVQGSRVNA